MLLFLECSAREQLLKIFCTFLRKFVRQKVNINEAKKVVGKITTIITKSVSKNEKVVDSDL